MPSFRAGHRSLVMWDSHNPVSDSKTREAKNKKKQNKKQACQIHLFSFWFRKEEKNFHQISGQAKRLLFFFAVQMQIIAAAADEFKISCGEQT